MIDNYKEGSILPSIILKQYDMLKRRLVDNQNIYKIDDDTVFLAHADGTTMMH